MSGDGSLGSTGIDKVLHCSEAITDSGQWAKLTAAAAQKEGASAVVASHDHFGRAVAPRVAVRLQAGLVAGVTELPANGLVRKNVFSGKAMADVCSEHTDSGLHRDPNALGSRCIRRCNGRVLYR